MVIHLFIPEVEADRGGENSGFWGLIRSGLTDNSGSNGYRIPGREPAAAGRKERSDRGQLSAAGETNMGLIVSRGEDTLVKRFYYQLVMVQFVGGL